MKEYLKYTHKSLMNQITVSACAVLFIVCGLALIHMRGWVGLLILLLGIISLVSVIIQMSLTRKKATEETGEERELLSDFSSAESISEDAARIGHIYIFRKYFEHPIRLEDVRRAEYTRRSGSDSDSSDAIFLILKNGREEKLCELYGPERENTAVDIFAVLKSRITDLETNE